MDTFGEQNTQIYTGIILIERRSLFLSMSCFTTKSTCASSCANDNVRTVGVLFFLSDRRYRNPYLVFEVTPLRYNKTVKYFEQLNFPGRIRRLRKVWNVSWVTVVVRINTNRKEKKNRQNVYKTPPEHTHFLREVDL